MKRLPSHNHRKSWGHEIFEIWSDNLGACCVYMRASSHLFSFCLVLLQEEPSRGGFLIIPLAFSSVNLYSLGRCLDSFPHLLILLLLDFTSIAEKEKSIILDEPWVLIFGDGGSSKGPSTTSKASPQSSLRPKGICSSLQIEDLDLFCLAYYIHPEFTLKFSGLGDRVIGPSVI